MVNRLVESGNAAVVLTVEDQQRVATQGVVTAGLPASVTTWWNDHPLHGRAPFVARDHRSAMRTESHEHDAVFIVRLPDELSDVHHPGARHVGIPRVTDVRV